MRAEARRLVQSTPEEVLDLVMDPERYALVDDKIRSVRWVRRSEDGSTVDFAFAPAVPGVPLPLPSVVVRMRRREGGAGRRVESGYASAPYNRLVRRFTTLEACFAVQETAGGTEVVRRGSLTVRGPLGAVLDRRLARRMQADLERELAGSATLLETGRAPDRVRDRDEVVLTRPSGPVSAEDWARRTFEQLPWAGRWLLVASWRAFLRLRLGPGALRRDVPGRVVGWRLTSEPLDDGSERAPSEEAVMSVGSPLLSSRLVFTVEPDRLRVRTQVDPITRSGRLVWAIALPLHRLALPVLARRAAAAAGRR